VLFLILIVLVVLFLGGGFATRGHPTYGSYSGGGIGLGGLLLLIVVILLVTGSVHF
jgi:hypothetical protein